jgi:hypothetical protein
MQNINVAFDRRIDGAGGITMDAARVSSDKSVDVYGQSCKFVGMSGAAR